MCISQTSSSIEDNSGADLSVLTPYVKSNVKLLDKMKNFPIAGFVLSWIFFVPTTLYEVFFAFYNTPSSSVSKFRFFIFVVMVIIMIMIVCFSVLDSTYSATTKTSLGRWSIANDVKNWIIMRKWIRLFVNSQENNRSKLPKS